MTVPQRINRLKTSLSGIETGVFGAGIIHWTAAVILPLYSGIYGVVPGVPVSFPLAGSV